MDSKLTPKVEFTCMVGRYYERGEVDYQVLLGQILYIGDSMGQVHIVSPSNGLLHKLTLF